MYGANLAGQTVTGLSAAIGAGATAVVASTTHDAHAAIASLPLIGAAYVQTVAALSSLPLVGGVFEVASEPAVSSVRVETLPDSGTGSALLSAAAHPDGLTMAVLTALALWTLIMAARALFHLRPLPEA